MDRVHNYDALRLWAAVAVIFSHGFLIAEGTEDREPLQMLTGEILGIYGVFTFFVLSGYLITQSRRRSRSTLDFLWRRAVRIVPAYVVSVIVAVLVLSPPYADGGVRSFVAEPGTWRLIAQALCFELDVVYSERVVFYASTESLGSVVNGVFWTIRVELALYVVVALLHLLRLLNLYTALLIALASTIAFATRQYPSEWWPAFFGLPGFFAGAALEFAPERLRTSGRLALAFVACTIVAGVLGHVDRLFPLLAAQPLVWLGCARAPGLGNWARFGDLSYGVYVFGWPLQQVVRAFVGTGASGWTFFLWCLPPVLLTGWCSWRFVERPALRLKRVWSKAAGRPS